MKTNESRRGQSLIEFCLVAPVYFSLVAAVTGLIAIWGLRSAIDAESFALSRARLYGNTTRACRPGAMWGSGWTASSRWGLLYRCQDETFVEARFHYRDWIRWHTSWDLAHGIFRRGSPL